MMTEVVNRLSIAHEATERVIAAVGDEQWSYPTPCGNRSVADLVDHIIRANMLFSHVVAAEPSTTEIVQPGGDFLETYRDSADSIVEAISQPGALERIISVPFGSVMGVVALHIRITKCSCMARAS